MTIKNLIFIASIMFIGMFFVSGVVLAVQGNLFAVMFFITTISLTVGFILSQIEGAAKPAEAGIQL